MAELAPKSGGVVSLVRNLLHTAVDAAHNRVDLFALELREERLRFVTLLAWAGVVLFLGFMAAGAITFALVLLFDEANRPWAAGVMGLLYLGGAVAVYRGLRVWLKKQQAPFAETTEQLKKDKAWLESLKPNS